MNIKKTLLIITSVLVLFIFIILLKFSASEQVSKDKVAATIFPLYDITRNIAGDEIETVLLLKPGASPHTFDPTPKEIKDLSGSKAIFAIGHGLDDWSVKLADAGGVSETIIVDKNIELITSEESHEHGGEDDHEEAHEGGVDPHYWLSAPNAILISRQVADELSDIFPERKDEFEDNYLAFSKKLEALDENINEKLGLQTRKIAAFHNAWSYFAKDHGVDIVATFEEFPGEEPTAQYLVEFENAIQSQSVKVIFAEPQFSTKSIEPIAKDMGVVISMLDPLGGVDGRQSFEELMDYNVNQIIKVLR